MKNLFIKPFEKLILLMLGCIGFLTGCDLIFPPVAEYGVPHADYEIKGTVTDSITSTPIKNARVIITQKHIITEKDSTFTLIDTLSRKETDGTGKYDIQFQDFPLEENIYQVKVDDIDGMDNGGNFNAQEKSVTFKHSDLSGGKSGWYVGKATKIIDIKLQIKAK